MRISVLWRRTPAALWADVNGIKAEEQMVLATVCLNSSIYLSGLSHRKNTLHILSILTANMNIFSVHLSFTNTPHGSLIMWKVHQHHYCHTISKAFVKSPHRDSITYRACRLVLNKFEQWICIPIKMYPKNNYMNRIVHAPTLVFCSSPI